MQKLCDYIDILIELHLMAVEVWDDVEVDLVDLIKTKQFINLTNENL